MLRRWLGLFVAFLFFAVAPLLPGHRPAITGEDEGGAGIGAGVAPPGGRPRPLARRPPTTGYDLKKTQRFWRSYKLPKVREKPPKRPKEYLDVD